MEAPVTPPGWENVPERLCAINAPDGKSRAWGCRSYCEKGGYLIDDEHVYREVFSGATLDARPEL